MADTLSQDNVQGVLGEFNAVLDRAVAALTVNNVQGVFGEFVAVLDETAGLGDSDTYFVVSVTNPDTLDLYVEGTLVLSGIKTKLETEVELVDRNRPIVRYSLLSSSN